MGLQADHASRKSAGAGLRWLGSGPTPVPPARFSTPEPDVEANNRPGQAGPGQLDLSMRLWRGEWCWWHRCLCKSESCGAHSGRGSSGRIPGVVLQTLIPFPRPVWPTADRTSSAVPTPKPGLLALARRGGQTLVGAKAAVAHGGAVGGGAGAGGVRDAAPRPPPWQRRVAGAAEDCRFWLRAAALGAWGGQEGAHIVPAESQGHPSHRVCREVLRPVCPRAVGVGARPRWRPCLHRCSGRRGRGREAVIAPLL